MYVYIHMHAYMPTDGIHMYVYIHAYMHIYIHL